MTTICKDPTQIGETLRKLRGDRPQQMIADAAGVSSMAISLYERGERVPGDQTKVALANYFGRTVEEIFFTTK